MQTKGLKPGIYFNLPIEEYHADPALSKSSIMDLSRSLLDYWVNSWMNPKESQKEKTRSMKNGSLTDILLFEKERFDKEYFVTGHSSFGDPRKMITAAAYNKAMDAINLLFTVNYANWLLSDGCTQVSLFWLDEQSGLMFKSRPDWLRPSFAVDYKTIESIDDSDITFQLTKYGYAIQSALGRQGMKVLKTMLQNKEKLVIDGAEKDQKKMIKTFAATPDSRFRFIFQRNTYPYPIKMKHMSDDCDNTAWAIIQKMANKFKVAYEQYGTGQWPATDNEISEEVTIFEMNRKFSLMANQ